MRRPSVAAWVIGAAMATVVTDWTAAIAAPQEEDAAKDATAAAEKPETDQPEDAGPRAVRPQDYGQFESLGRATLSPDGRWLAYSVSRVDGHREVRLKLVAGDDEKTFAYGQRQAFSDDGKWLGLLLGVSEKEREKLDKAKKPVRTKLALHDLVRGETDEIDDVASFSFSDDGRFLVMRRYALSGRKSSGVDIVFRDLESGIDSNFGNVSSYAFNDDGHLIAMVIDAEGQAGNGISVFNADTGVLRTLDSADAQYKSMTWREDAADLAVLREMDHDEDKDEDVSHVVLTWRGLDRSRARAKSYDHTADEKFSEDLYITANGGLRWSEAGDAVFFGLTKWENKPKGDEDEEKNSDKDSKKDADKTREKGAKDEKPEGDEDAEKDKEKDKEATGEEESDDKKDEDKDEDDKGKKDTEKGTDKGKDKDDDKAPPAKKEALRDTLKDPAGVEVWHAADIDIIPRQKITAGQDERRNFSALWWIDENRMVQLGDDLVEQTRPVEGDLHALGMDNTPYETERRFGPTLYDVYLIDCKSGERSRILEQSKFLFGSDPTGQYVLHFKNGNYHIYDIRNGRHTDLTSEIDDDFIRDEGVQLTDESPPHGTAGWSEDGRYLYLYSRYDLWQLELGGSNARRVTDGTERMIRFRRVVLDPEEDEFIDPSRPILVSAYGDRTKESGYALAKVGEAPEMLVYEPRSVGRLVKAENAEVYALVRGDFDDPPDVFVTDRSLKGDKALTAINAFQSDYLWGRSELIDYQNDHGQDLQGALFYPAGYEAGKKYPMITYIYELRSQTLHSYQTPSELSAYNTAVFTSEGYFVYQPDIVYRPQNPGLSAVECVVPAVKKVIATGMVDSERVGLVGHSWGAYQTAFITTHSDVFAAGVAGAPLTNMMSMSMSIYWNSGQTDTWIFHESQGRMDRPFWNDVDTYIKNSPIFGIEDLNTPLLVAFGTEDGAVDFNQGVEMYNAARLAQKPFVMLVYPGENHGLRQKPNQLDYHYRIKEWFGHYLKGEEAPAWITEGQSHLERKKELEAMKKKGEK